MESHWRTSSPAETERVGEHLAALCARVRVLALRGDLGAGKTVLTRGIARALGCAGRVSSPTFAIVHEHAGVRRLCHFDMYRLPDADALWDIGWQDYLDSGALCVVEWSENVEAALPPDTAVCTLTAPSAETRCIDFSLPEAFA